MDLLHFKTYNKVTVGESIYNKNIYKGTNQQTEIENIADNQKYMKYHKNYFQVN